MHGLALNKNVFPPMSLVEEAGHLLQECIPLAFQSYGIT